ncbi:hypothetical protein E1B28_006152 [Marasmius oreades]|uniref:Tail specific protease domain-containing protein n=1 Tax=Marasmius oreades TaxID=181124 RepID=A0A9P7S4R6_9AGAR|nr:uncharacterized protein E1B28_006152 [Marasmius oreades]KAG7095399.1 hypothetical protein E1B28_006152 [Marasmius oreades]
MFTRLLAFLSIVGYALSQNVGDPCTKLAGKKWVDPRDLRACFQSFNVDQAIKENIIEVVSKTLAFHTSVNYEIQAPPPFDKDVHEDLVADLARIKHESYPSDYDLHIDLSRTLKRLNDGHCVWINSCYVSSYLNFLPIPLVLLTDESGKQTVNIAPEAFSVASTEFSDQIQVWQDALPGVLKGKLQSLNGAEVLAINGQEPFIAVNANAAITGSFQGFGTRQNSFFSSYQRSTNTFNYLPGNFAQQSLPLSDSVVLDIVRVNNTKPEQITLPYRARINTALNFTNGASYRSINCSPTNTTNGVDVYATRQTVTPPSSDAIKFQQAPPMPQSKKQLVNVMLDATPLSNVVLPPELQPPSRPLDGSFGVGSFYDLDDGKTGVLALGSFSGADFNVMQEGMLKGLTEMKARGKTQLIVDVTNNGGGFICVAHWLHRIIAGPKDTTVPQAGLDTKARNPPLARAIVNEIVVNNRDPQLQLLYNPLQWNNASNQPFGAKENWLIPPVNVTINGRPDQFSQRLGQECQPFSSPPPDVALFDISKVAIVSNGRCASSCSLFSVTMKKLEGAKTVVVGGKKDVQQEYCGTVGGQSTDFATIDTEIKTVHLKNDSAAPPDLKVRGVQGITWRLGFALDNSGEPEEWKEHFADLNLPLTPALVNNPNAIWKEVASRLFT